MVNPMASTIVLLLVAASGLIVGLGSYTFQRAEGTSYLRDDPAACVNCHVMRDQYEAWNHSSHREWATCNDCHTPEGFFNAYFTKALNGWNHSVKFTTMNFPEPIRIGGRNREITMQRCVDCHSGVTTQMGISAHDATTRIDCTHCHGNPGHQTLGRR